MKYDKPGTYKVKIKAVDQCGNTTEVERTIIVEGNVTITGANDVTINQGIGIDLTNGVSATGVSGQSIPFTVDPESIEKCDVGEHEVTYTATDSGITETVTRKVTITAIDDPTISGLTDLTVNVGEEFDPLEGVTAKDGNGNDVAVEVEAPSEHTIA